MTRPQEIELKLAIVDGSLADTRRALRGAQLRRSRIDDVYFDTSDQRLRRHGLILRLRHDAGRWLQTLKSDSETGGVVPERGEWEVELEGEPTQPDLERFDVTTLRRLMRTGVEASALVPMFRIRVTRHRAIVQHRGSDIEVSLDCGEVRTRRDGKTEKRPLRELEIELKHGSPIDVIDLALALVSRQGRHTLVPALRSKGERGYALASAQPLDVVRANARSFARELDPSMSTAAALRSVVRRGLSIVVANADAMRDAPSSELVHQMRVALRRMRSAIRLFDPDGADFPQELLRRLRWLARTLGTARDWDVMVESTLPAVMSDPASSSLDLEPLRKATKSQRRKTRAAAIDAIGSRRYGKLVLRLAEWTASTAPDTGTLREVAAERLDRVAEGFFTKAKSFARLPAAGRHEVRILAKRFRYALDLLAVALPPQAAAEFVDALAATQDTLGELNDGYVALDLLGGIKRDKSMQRALEDWFAGSERTLAAEGSRRLAALARRPRPWTAAAGPPSRAARRR